MRLRGALLKSVTVVMVTAALVLQASASPQETVPDQGQTKPRVDAAQPNFESISSYEGLTVADIKIPELTVNDQKALRSLIVQETGKPLDREKIRESIQALYGTGRFADIRVEAERDASGRVSLSFVATPNYFIGQVTVEGAPNRPNANQIANASKLPLGELFTREKLDRALKNIKQLMEENGYYHSSVREEESKQRETQQVDVVLRVTSGQQAQVGRVNVTGHPGYSSGQIEDIAKMHSADPASAQRVTRALDRLRKKYQKQNRLLAQVTLASRSYRPEVNAVDYTFHVEPGPKVDIGAEGFRIRRGVLTRNVPVYEENALDDDLLNEGRRNLVNYLQSRGYFDAKVDLKKQSDPGGDELRVIYLIDAGPRHKLLQLEITGNHYFPEELLRSNLHVQAAGRFFSRGRYSQALLNDDIHGLEYLYLNNGFQQVKITSNVEDNYRGHHDELAISILVDEGPQTLVGKLQIVGNSHFTEDQLRANITTAEGQPFSDFNVAQDRDTILNFYFNRGFPNAKFEATAKALPEEPNHVDVTFTVHEGDQIFVDQVMVSGLYFTRPFVAQRELQVKSGDPLSQIDMLKTQQGLYDLGLFSQVDTAVQNPEGNEREKNVLVAVQEAKRYTFNYGVGLEFQTGQPAVGSNQPQGETGVSPRVSFGVTRLNFRGRNDTITFKSHVGRLQQRALISYEEPRWFNSRDWRMSVTLFYDNTLDVATFTSQRLEGSVQAAQTISKISTMLYRFTYRRVRASNLQIDPEQIPLLSQPTRVGMPGFSYLRDKRDNVLETTRGNYTTIDGGVASGYFGSEADFSRILMQNSTYYAFGKKRPGESIKKYVFARSTRIGLENPFRDTVSLLPGQVRPAGASVIPLPELFFSGGGNSHRGFGLNQAGPRDPTFGFPLGGSALFLNNLELRFPPTTLPFFQDNISFAIFHDAGNVFSNEHEMVHNLLRWRQKNPELCLQQSTADQCDYSYISHAIGVGVRYKTPIGPVRFDFGYNLNPPAFPSLQTPDPNNPLVTIFVPQHARHFNVFFSIGQTF